MPPDLPGLYALSAEANLRERGLERVSYVAGLRPDMQAATYADRSGHLYLRPLAHHDYLASHALTAAGLSGGTVIYGRDPEHPDEPKPELIGYGDADFVTLSAVLNSSIDVPDAYEDMVSAITGIGEFLKAAKEKCDFVPTIATIPSWAIDKVTGNVELLPPFLPSQISSPAQMYTDLLEDIRAKANVYNENDRQVIERVLADSASRVTW